MEASSRYACDARWRLAPDQPLSAEGAVDGVVATRRLGSTVVHGDRFGAVPLYHRIEGRSVHIATSPYLLGGGRIPDAEAVARARQGRSLEAAWLWEGVGRIRPGRRLVYAEGAVRIDERPRLMPSEEDGLDALRAAVARCAPDAVLLSGGLDSSALLVLCLDAGLRPVALSVDDGASGDDRRASEAVARHLGVPHEVVSVDLATLEESFDRAVRASEAPLYDLRAVSKLLLYEAAAARGYRRLVSGTGADEVLFGHDRLARAPDPRQARFRWVRGGFYEEALPLESTMARRCGVTVELPYLDVGFVAAMWYRPVEDLVKDGVGKAWLREVMRGRLPDSVREARKRPVLVGGMDPEVLRARAVEVLLRS